MSREIMQQALSAFEAIMFEKDAESCQLIAKNARYALREELAKPEPVAHAVIAGVLFDFMGWLTSRPKRIVLSASDDASPAVKVIEEFAKMRGLSLDDAKVKDWQDMTAPPRKPWVGLTDKEIFHADNAGQGLIEFARAIEAKLKEKNRL